MRERGFRFESRFINNSIVIIDGLRGGDLQTGLKVFNEIRDLCEYQGARVYVERIHVSSAAETRVRLEEIQARCKEGLRPILHFECHGDAVNGLEVGEGQEKISWSSLELLLRKINVASCGNLGVVMAACYGLYAISPIKIHRAAPFLFLLGSDDKVGQGDLEKYLPKFYRKFIQTHNLDEALAEVSVLKSWHAEKMLAIAMGRYFKNACSGRGGERRVEELVSLVRYDRGPYANREQLRKVRTALKKGLRESVSAKTLEKFAGPFLAGRACSFSFDELIKWIKS